MPKHETLDKVEQEILEGKLGVARDRLHGLITTYPEDISLRSRLGDVYWALGYPELAGQWWFLDDDLTDDKREAVRAFAKVCSQDADAMMRALKLGELDVEVAERAASRLAEFGDEPEFSPEDLKFRPKKPAVQSDMFFACGCVAAAILILALAVVGLVSLLRLLL